MPLPAVPRAARASSWSTTELRTRPRPDKKKTPLPADTRSPRPLLKMLLKAMLLKKMMPPKKKTMPLQVTTN